MKYETFMMGTDNIQAIEWDIADIKEKLKELGVLKGELGKYCMEVEANVKIYKDYEPVKQELLLLMQQSRCITKRI